MMFSLFGKKKQNKSPSEGIIQLRDALNSLEKREKYLEKRIEQFKTEARKELQNKRKQKAVFLMKKAKMNEKQLLTIYGMKENLERQIFAIEEGINNANIVNAMKEGKNILTDMSTKVDADDIGDLMDDLNEAMDIGLEVSNAVSQPIGDPVDEDELMDELLEEESLTIEDEILEVSSVLSVVDIPEEPKTIKKTEDQELEELEKMMFA